MIRNEATLCRYCKTKCLPHTSKTDDSSGLISPQEWEAVQRERESTGEPVSLILSRLGHSSETHLKNALEHQYGVHYIALLKTEIWSDCVQLLPEAFIRQYQAVPIRRSGDALIVAMVNPKDLGALDALRAYLHSSFKPVVCSEEAFQLFMQLRYPDIVAPHQETESEEPSELAEDAPIVLLANMLLSKGITCGAKEIRFAVQEKELVVWNVINGAPELSRRLPPPLVNLLRARFEALENKNDHKQLRS